MPVLICRLCLLILWQTSLASAASSPRFVGHYEGEAILRKRHVTDLVVQLDVTAKQGAYELQAMMRFIDREAHSRGDGELWPWGGSGRLHHGTLRFDGTAYGEALKGENSLRQAGRGLILTLEGVRYRLRPLKKPPLPPPST